MAVNLSERLHVFPVQLALLAVPELLLLFLLLPLSLLHCWVEVALVLVLLDSASPPVRVLAEWLELAQIVRMTTFIVST